MHITETNLESVGIYSLSELARRTGVPLTTIKAWVQQKRLPVVKIDGKYRTTVHMAKLAAEQAREDGRGKPRSWRLAPADHDEAIPTEETEHVAV